MAIIKCHYESGQHKKDTYCGISSEKKRIHYRTVRKKISVKNNYIHRKKKPDAR
jgi:hypothetical protein